MIPAKERREERERGRQTHPRTLPPPSHQHHILPSLSVPPLQVNFKEPTPPDQPLILRSTIVKIKDAPAAGGRASVQVDLTLHLEGVDGSETLLAAGTGIFKKLGALRAL